MRAQYAGGIAKLDADDHAALSGEVVAPHLGIGGAQDRHPAAVHMQQPGQRSGGVGRPVYVQRDFVAVDTGHGLRAGVHALGRGEVGEQRFENGLVGLLGFQRDGE